MKGLPVLYMVMIGLTGCAQSEADRDRLAAQGLIQEDAPIKAVAEVVIAAPAAKILGLLTNVGAWPQWQPGISTAAIHGNPAVGTKFDWSSGGMQIHSTLQLLEPERVCWTGRVLHMHAIHCWTLSSLPDNTVLVNTRESMEGWLASRIYSSSELLKSDEHWLAQLKQAAEH